jgi:hypothetical protein
MRGSTVARLLGFQVRIPPGSWMSVPFECCELSGSLCNGLITRPEESYHVLSSSVIQLHHRGDLGPQGLSGHKKKDKSRNTIDGVLVTNTVQRGAMHC